MKIKQNRDDFVVREITNIPLDGGRFGVYRLHKSGLGTPEAISQVLRGWNLNRGSVAYAGLKDRHAVTEQTITIADGPEEDFYDRDVSLTFQGRTRRPITAQAIEANEFDCILRGLEAQQAERMQQLVESPQLLIPNYFDEQRFGSVGASGDFVAVPWCKGDYEKALYLAIAEHNPHDRPNDREQKAILRNHWGDWSRCKADLERSHRRSIVTYLVDHPTGFKKAAGLIRRDLRSLYVSAFQSKLWNEVLSRYIQQSNAGGVFMDSVAGRWAFPVAADDFLAASLRELTVPLPSGRSTNWNAELLRILETVVAEFELEIHKLRFSYPRDVFFSRAKRAAVLQIQSPSAVVEDDECASEPYGKKLRLQFRLQAGQYATMVFKGLELLSAS